MVTTSSARSVRFSIGTSLRFRALPRAELPTVYTPWRGVYCPDINDARLGAQFGAAE